MIPSRSSLRLAAAFSLSLVAASGAFAQTADSAGKSAGPEVFCDRERAFTLLEQQTAESKAFENKAKRIGVLLRAADLLWPHRRETARKLFAESFELASEDFRERGDVTIKQPGRPDSEVSGLGVQLPDQRFVVLRTLARRDPAWARELTSRVAEETRREAKRREEGASERSERRENNVGDKLLGLALSLLPDDLPTAGSIATAAFRQKASRFYLPRFLYEAAKVDRAFGDGLYVEALNAYAGSDLDSLLLLSAYPFATHRLVGQTLGHGVYNPPPGFAPKPELQRLFVETLLRLAEKQLAAAMQLPPAAVPARLPSETERVLASLLALETLYGQADPSFLERSKELKQLAGGMLLNEEQRRAISNSKLDLTPAPGLTTGGTYERLMERLDKIADPDLRDREIVIGLQGVLRDETLERLVAAGDKIGDLHLRRQFMDFVFFAKAQAAIKSNLLDEAANLAWRVNALDQRALLALEIAAAGIKATNDVQRAREQLESVLKAARGAPDTDAKSRALLGTAYLYSNLDHVRAIEALAEAVKTINNLPELDLHASHVTRKMEGRKFSSFMNHPAPAFNLENAFREAGARDFDGALSVAEKFSDKSHRATAILALSARCLEDAAKPVAVKPAATTVRGERGKPVPVENPLPAKKVETKEQDQKKEP